MKHGFFFLERRVTFVYTFFSTPQQAIYDETARVIVNGVMNGYNGTSLLLLHLHIHINHTI